MNNQLFFYALPLLLITHFISLTFIIKFHPVLYNQLGKPRRFWSGATEMSYLFSYVIWFRFITLKPFWLVITLTINALTLWFIIFVFVAYFAKELHFIS
ncbi:hypothetical protein A10D4_13476 [Idiomarina xiamenensis 10-D-4]|uniref:Uncharacterized protein n=1 Tax=Idiomarina xiamenensis 10-D-4 TaxID=740709 RepID=K2J3M7_9GAMM|nr:hypothetical protein A10D4_13476 [Idiomarina xiamenensis 10-D-4]